MPEGLPAFRGITSIARGALPALLGGIIGDELVRGLWDREWFYTPDVAAQPARLGFHEAGWQNVCTLSLARCTSETESLGTRQISGTGSMGLCFDQCGQATAGNVYPTEPSASHTRLTLYRRTYHPFPTIRMHSYSTWNRNQGSLAPKVLPAYAARPGLALPVPMVEPHPFYGPVGQFAPRFARVSPPRISPDPWRNPWEQSREGPGPHPARIAEWVALRPGVQVRPGVLPQVVADVGPAQPPPSRPSRRQPPSRRTREVKIRANAAFTAAVFGAVNLVTESLDILDALWDALPPWRKRMINGVQTSPWHKASDIAAAFEAGLPEGFWGRFLRNLGVNEIGDQIGGFQGRMATSATRATGVNFQRGPADRPPNADTRSSRERRRQERNDRRWARRFGNQRPSG